MKSIPLTRGYSAIVDDSDYEDLMRFKWTYTQTQRMAAGHGYATRPKTSMHRYLMNPPEGMQVDHINGDGLDNRRSNLRICSLAENRRNRRPSANKRGPSFKGVSWYQTKRRLKFTASISRDGKITYVRGFLTAEQAALGYDVMAVEMFGEFARLNFPEIARCESFRVRIVRLKSERKGVGIVHAAVAVKTEVACETD